jgi:hypothetical protein
MKAWPVKDSDMFLRREIWVTYRSMGILNREILLGRE